MKDRLTVREFSELARVKDTTLRHWDDIGLFSPLLRDPENNYRYYSPGQVLAVNFFKVLSSLDVPLKVIKSMDESRDPESIVQLIEQQEKILDREMKRLQECYSIIHTRREMIHAGMTVREGKVQVMRMSECAFSLGPENAQLRAQGPFECFMNFCQQAEAYRINLNLPVCGYYNSMGSFLEDSETPDYFISLDPEGEHKRVEGDYLVSFYRGRLGKFGDREQQMVQFALENGLTFVGPVYTQYLLDEICIKDPKDYLVQISVAVSK